MKKIPIIIISLAFVMSYFSVASPAAANDGQLRPAEETVFDSISMDCLDVKMNLSAIHQQDGLLRVNAGSAYGDISDKLIARLNAKVASESLDGADLISNASNVREHRQEFDNSYRLYERAMNQLLKADCQSRQHQFYQDLQEVQQMRSEVYGSMNRTNQAVDNYFTAFEGFKHDYLRDYEETDEAGDNDE